MLPNNRFVRRFFFFAPNSSQWNVGESVKCRMTLAIIAIILIWPTLEIYECQWWPNGDGGGSSYTYTNLPRKKLMEKKWRKKAEKIQLAQCAWTNKLQVINIIENAKKKEQRTPTNTTLNTGNMLLVFHHHSFFLTLISILWDVCFHKYSGSLNCIQSKHTESSSDLSLTDVLKKPISSTPPSSYILSRTSVSSHTLETYIYR